MSTPNNPYGSNNNDGRGDLPSFGDYSQNSNDNYNAGHNNAYDGGFEQFPASPEAGLHGGGYAGAGKRIGALLIDYVILVVIFIAVTLMFSSQLNDINDWLASSDDNVNNMPSVGAVYAVLLLPPILWLIYKIAMESWRGQTLGKMAIGIKVVDADGKLVSAVSSLIRNSWFIIGFLLMLFTSNLGLIAFILIQIILGVLIARNNYDQHTCDTWAKAYVVTAR
ncbi:MAG TPA: RDD family protein [Candidatus Corynebacterium avicola]|uniref:RDD family protein n=1 Tax=Candidatus Corynebacterium avicola TaxID=2838527 RepID=A0A9D1RP77_9CORY|nr:RDD family protein [Candidatus Corynebacterium avicola]